MCIINSEPICMRKASRATIRKRQTRDLVARWSQSLWAVAADLSLSGSTAHGQGKGYLTAPRRHSISQGFPRAFLPSFAVSFRSHTWLPLTGLVELFFVNARFLVPRHHVDIYKKRSDLTLTTSSAGFAGSTATDQHHFSRTLRSKSHSPWVNRSWQIIGNASSPAGILRLANTAKFSTSWIGTAAESAAVHHASTRT